MIYNFFSSFLLAIPILSPRPNIREYNILNNCPADIDLYIGGLFEANIPRAGNVTRFLSTDAGFFYTDANGGNPSGAGTTRAGFFGNVGIHRLHSLLLLTLPQDLYYMVQDRAHINIGIQIKPRDRSSVSIYHEKIYRCSLDESLCRARHSVPRSNAMTSPAHKHFPNRRLGSQLREPPHRRRLIFNARSTTRFMT
jgi:hypothetical protein